MHTFNVFDFLRDIVKKVPDLGGSDAASEDRCATKRRLGASGKFYPLVSGITEVFLNGDVLTFCYHFRKVIDDEDNESDEDSKRTKTVVG